MPKSYFMSSVLLAGCFSLSGLVDAAPKPATTKSTASKSTASKAAASKAKIAQLADGAFGSIWMDSDLEDTEAEFDVRAALDAGVSPDARDKYGDTLLLQAIENNRPGVVSLLLRRGANINLPDSDPKSGDTPLIRAASVNDVWAEGRKPLTSLVKLLLGHRPELNRFNKSGETALTLAAAEGESEIVAALLKAGANFRLANKKGATPLWLASHRLSPNSVYYGGSLFSVPHSDDPKAFEKAFAKHQKMLDEMARADERRIAKGRAAVRGLLLKAGAKK